MAGCRGIGGNLVEADLGALPGMMDRSGELPEKTVWLEACSSVDQDWMDGGREGEECPSSRSDCVSAYTTVIRPLIP